MKSTDITPEQVLAQLKHDTQSLVLSTLGTDGFPHSGYTPFVFGEATNSHCLYIFVSQLSLHTRDLLANGKVSAMLIRDESHSEQIFARARVTYQCQASVIERSSSDFDALLGQLQQQHGKMIGLLKTLPDFVLFELTPHSGQLVMGFGQAYKLVGEKLNQFEHTKTA